MKSKIFIKALIGLIFIITIYAVSVFFVVVPKVKENSYVQEEKIAIVELDKITTLVKNTHKELVKYKDLAIQKEKDRLRNLTEVAFNSIKYQYSMSSKKNISLLLKQRAKILKNLIQTYYKNNVNKMDPKELKNSIKEFIRAYRYNDGEGYFWINDFRPYMIMHPIMPSKLEGKDMSKVHDINGFKMVVELTKKCKKSNEGFVQYKWPNAVTNVIEDKFSYGFVFKPYNWIIGTGEYHSTLQKRLKKEVYKYISNVKYGKNGYFFIISYDGITLSHPDPSQIGKRVIDARDVKGKKFIKQMLDIAKKEGRGFITYWWKKPKEDKKAYEKLSYFIAFPNWKWIIGTGVYIDEIEAEVQRRKQELIKQLDKILKNTKIGNEGYIYIFDGKANMIIHPNSNLNGKNFAKLKNPDNNSYIFNDLVKAAKTTGKLSYKWDKPNDKDHYKYKKIAWVRYIPEFDWYIASSVYESDLNSNSKKISQFIVSLSIAMVIFSIIFGVIFFRGLLRPIEKLTKTALKVKNGDLGARANIKSDDEVGILANEFNTMVDTILSNLINLEENIRERTKKIKNLLDNANEGFLSFSKDFIIEKEYSKECVTFFNKEIAGLNIVELLYKNNKNRQDIFIKTINLCLTSRNKIKNKYMLNLLDKEIEINNKILEVEYKIVENSIMMILTDITEKKLLQEKIEIEQNNLKMVVVAISNTEEFFELISDYENFCDQKSYIDKTKISKDNIYDIYRAIHTFKGLFAQKHFTYAVKRLHQLESQLSNILQDNNFEIEKLDDIIIGKELKKWIEDDMNVIISILGEDFLNKKGKILVKEEEIQNIVFSIEKYIKIYNLENEKGAIEILNNAKRLQLKSLKKMFSSFPKLVDQISQRLNKSVKPLIIEADEDILVGNEFKPFVKSLVHIFRNCIDHGIESIEDRIKLNKEPSGTIQCKITKNDKVIKIVIEDDGAGIDINKIKQKLQKTYSKNEIENFSEDELLNFIFEDSFTTKDEVSELSGRGIGLSAVKNELDKLGGKLRIKNYPKNGVKFIFEFYIS